MFRFKNVGAVVCLLIISINSWGQCSSTPVVEAVRNGDFEMGYLPGSNITSPVNSHTYTSGGPFDFQSSLQYAGEWKGSNNPCDWGIADQYGVGRSERSTNNCDTRTMPVYGRYSPTYRDHTLGTNKGFALFVDLNLNTNFRVIWAQTVDVFPSQLYYFSAWFAQYGGNQAAPTLRFRVITYDAGGTQLDEQVVGTAPVKSPMMSWQQFNGQYSTPANAVTARLFIDGDPTGNSNQDDFVIDDISFINGCQNIASDIAYQIKFPEEKASLCYNEGSYEAQILKDNNTNLGEGKTITWYKGSGTTQLEVPSLANKQIATLTTTGTYRACVVDPVNSGCTVNSTIKINKELTVSLPATEELCNPSQITLNTGRTETGLVHSWSVPTGETASTNRTQTVKSGGNYEATVSLPSVVGCSKTAATIVTSKLPSAPTGMEYCLGDPVELEVNDGKTYKWLEDDKITVIGTENGSAVVWTGAPTTIGNYQVSLQSAETTALSPALGGTSFPTYPVAAQAKNIAFTVSEPVVLKSFVVHAEAWVSGCNAVGTKTNGVFSISGPATFSVTKQLNCGATTRVTVNWTLPPGNYVLNTNKNLKRKPSFGTATIPGFVQVTSTNNRVYGSMTFAASKSCEPVLVDIEAKNCCTPATVTSEPSDDEVCEGGNSSFSVNASGVGTKTFQWQVKPIGGSWSNLTGSGATTKNLSLSNVSIGDDGNKYRAKVTLNGNCDAFSKVAILTVNPIPETPTISGTTILCDGDNLSLTAASGTSGVTYSWSDASTSNPLTKTVVAGDDGTSFTVTATKEGCVSASSVTSILTINDVPNIPGAITLPGTICKGGSSYAASIAAVSGADDYTWAYSGTGMTIIGTGSNVNFDVAANATAGDITVTANNTCGSSNASTQLVTLSDAPSITSAPTSSTVCTNDNVILNVSASGSSPLLYQWKHEGSNVGTDANSYTVNGVSTSTDGNYLVEVSNGCGMVTSNDAAINLKDVLAINTQPENLIACEGTIQTLTISARGSQTVSYQWKKGGVDIGGNINQLTFSPLSTTDVGTYSVDVADECTTLSSSPVSITVNEAIQITTEPQATGGCVGSSTSMNVIANGTAPLSYQWKKGTTNVGTGAAVLDFNPLAASDDGSYIVEVTNMCGSLISQPADVAITLNETPSVDLVADKSQLCGDGNTQITLTASGQGGGTVPSYVFSGGTGTIMPTGANATVIPTAVVGTDSMRLTYQVEMTSNSNCIAVGAPNPVLATVTIDLDPIAESATINQTDQTICTDGMSLTATTISLDQSGVWSKGIGTSGSIDANTGVVTGLAQSEAVEFIYTVSTPLSLCPTSVDNVNLFRAGDLTNPANVTVQSTTICSNVSAPQLTGLFLKPGETATWTAVAPATINSGTGLTSNLQTGENKFVYEIDNPASGCTSMNDTVRISIVQEPILTMVSPIADPHSVGASSETLSVTDLGADYTVSWSISGQGNIGGLKTGAGSSVTIDALDSDVSLGDANKTNVSVSVKDNGEICTAATNSFVIERVAQTIPSLGQDLFICEGSGVEINLPTLIPVLETESLLQNAGGAATINELTRKIEVANTLTPGTYSIEYQVENTVNGNASDIIQVIVDATSETSIPGTDDIVCSSSSSMGATPVVVGQGTWVHISGPGSIVDINNPSASITGMTETVSTKHAWVTSSLNDVCPHDSNTVTITQAGQLTAVDISGQSNIVCINSSDFSLNGTLPNTSAAETSVWRVSSSSPNYPSVFTQSSDGVTATVGDFTSAGDYIMEYAIVNGLCPGESSGSLTITVIDTAYIASASIDVGCEGEEVNAVALGVSSSSETVTWSSNSGAVLSGQMVTEARFILLEDGSETSNVSVVPFNKTCGEGNIVVASNSINLKPREVPVINGDTVVCGSKAYTYDQLVKTSDATSWEWSWKGINKGSTATLELKDVDLSGMNGNIELTPVNSCGKGISGQKTIRIQQTTLPQVALGFAGASSDGKVCEDEETLEVAVDLGYSNGGANATYEYYVEGSKYGNITSSSTLSIAQGDWKDGDAITVTMFPDVVTGCFTGSGTVVSSTSIIVEGFQIPKPTLSSSAAEACEKDGTITLSLSKNDTKGDVVDHWSGPSSSIVGLTSNLFNATNALDRGDYSVVVSNPECIATGETNIQSIMLYEQPQIEAFEFVNSDNKMIEYIDEEGQSLNQSYTVSVLGLNQDKGFSDSYSWNSQSLIVEQDQEDFTFETDGETDEFEYVSLVVSNGKGNVQCIDSLGFYITITLPLGVPNAFSPNGDGINDKWEIQGMNDYPGAHVSIYNRWGAKIYERFGGYPASDAWDGSDLPIGTYYYILNLNDKEKQTNGEGDVLRGAVTITK